MIVEYVEGGPLIGFVVWEREFKFGADAMIFMPQVGERIQLPHPYRKMRRVKEVTRFLGQNGMRKVRVLVEPAG